MIYLCIVRRCQCEVCQKSFDLAVDEKPPAKCKVCGSAEWLYGTNEIESRRVRMQIQKAPVTLNPGAKSLARREQGRRQYRGFKPKEGQD